jgi:hypothetical protein
MTHLTSGSEDLAPGVVSAAPRGLVGYLREGVQIARWDVEAVERVSRDPRALAYGALFLLLAGLLGGLPLLLRTDPAAPRWPFAVVGMVAGAVGQLVVSALATALIHGAGKLMFGASGQYVRLLRVLWVGSVVLWLGLLPVIGGLVGGVLYLLVTLIAVSEIEGVERLHALVLVIGLNALTMLAALLLAAA